MEELVKLHTKINIPSHEVTLDIIQEILIKTKIHKTDQCESEFWNQLCQVLWKHLEMGLKRFDDQLLCATCFYTVLPLVNKQDLYVNKILTVIENELNLRNHGKDSTNLYQAVSIIYGMFQSTFLTQNIDRDANIVEAFLKASFEVLTLMAYEYSQYTFIVFKTIKTFSKVCGSNLQNIIFNKENQVKLLNLVNHNWENPITGVRDLNRDIFQTLLSCADDKMYKLILDETEAFYWNKAKFLMISEIVEHQKKNIYDILQKNNWVDGLLYSLHKPGLVSAGADMYFAILKKIRSENEWCTLFLLDIMKISNSTSYKAIENFNNYWCLTTLKMYPALINIFIEELQKFKDTEQKLYSSLFIIKQGNKLGLISKNWASTTDYKFTENMVLRGMEHYNNHIRMLAFEVVCVSHGKTMPGKVEFELIIDFLNNNINSDCSVLRQSMLSSLKQFLLQLHATFLNNIKNNQYVDETNILYFCSRMQEIVIHSLNLNGNYQRKITCVKLANTIYSCIGSVPKKNNNQIKVTNTLIDFLKHKNCWMLSKKDVIEKLINLLNDPTDDVRENVIQLLLNHCPKEILGLDLMTALIDNAMICLKSKFFFEICCGQSIFKLVVSVMLRHRYNDAAFKNVEDVFLFGYKDLIAEYRMQTDVLTSIESGKQLHSFMSIMLVTLEACILNSYKMESSNIIITDLLDALEGISNQFSWEQENSTSYDFSKMSEMVQNMITQSRNKLTDAHDETKISGLHQIVLNCIWLNVKASCDLASLLIQYYTEDIGICQRCLVIITHVLETSRHKGAIEAGGAALGRGIQHLTSQPEESDTSKLPHTLLKSKLNDLLSETNRMASITRRGAGLSIMVHRIVSSDLRKSKPLFHFFMKILLKTCNRTEDIPDMPTESSKTENKMDLPKAIYIHFLTKIVTDSSLASDLMYYSAELAELAFFNLTSPHWQIRNAALQLHGALVPRQIGQKKASGLDQETVATVACDELRTHSPKLWKYVTEQLKNDSVLNKVLCHSNLVPILNMLANCAKRYNFSSNMAEQKMSDEELLASLKSLLGSPIYTVRRLTAKCIFNIYSMDTIYNAIIDQEYISENFLHGSLILIENCYKYYAPGHSYEDKFERLREKLKLILTVPSHSYMCKDLFEDIFTVHDFPENYLEETISELNNHKQIPGVFKWAHNRFSKYILNSSWDDIPQALKIILDCSDFKYYCESLYLKLEKDKSVPKGVLQNIVDILLSFDKKYDSSIIWKIIYHMSQLAKIEVDITTILENFEIFHMAYKLRYVIPLTARVCANNVENENIQFKIANIIYKLCDLENTDVDMRYIAALANNELANVFDHLSYSVRIISIKSAVILLQDEDEDVRMISVHFYKNINNQGLAVQPYVCLHKILDRKFMHKILNNYQQEIKDFCNDLSVKLLTNNTNCNNDDYNPFANDSKNIYLEGNALDVLLKNLLSNQN